MELKKVQHCVRALKAMLEVLQSCGKLELDDHFVLGSGDVKVHSRSTGEYTSWSIDVHTPGRTTGYVTLMSWLEWDVPCSYIADNRLYLMADLRNDIFKVKGHSSTETLALPFIDVQAGDEEIQASLFQLSTVYDERTVMAIFILNFFRYQPDTPVNRMLGRIELEQLELMTTQEMEEIMTVLQNIRNSV